MTHVATPEPLLRQIRLAGDHFKAIEERFCGQKSLNPNRWAIIRLDGHGFSHWVKRNFPTTKDNNWSCAFEHAMSAAAKEMAETYRPQLVYTFSDEVTLAFPPGRAMNLNGGRILKLCTLMASAMTARFAASSNLAPRSVNHPLKDLATFDARAFSLPSPRDVALNIGWRMVDARRNSVAHWARQYSSAKELHGLSSAQLIEHTENKGTPGQRPVPWRYLPQERQVGRLFQLCQTTKVFTEEAVAELVAANPKFDLRSMVEVLNEQTGKMEYLAHRSGYERVSSTLERFCRENPKSFFMADAETVDDLTARCELTAGCYQNI